MAYKINNVNFPLRRKQIVFKLGNALFEIFSPTFPFLTMDTQKLQGTVYAKAEELKKKRLKRRFSIFKFVGCFHRWKREANYFIGKRDSNYFT